MSNITEAQKIKAEDFLNKRMNFDIIENDQLVSKKVMTIKEHLEYLLSKGNYVKVVQIHDEAAEKRLRQKINCVRNSWPNPLGNENHPITKQYCKDYGTLEKGIFKDDYRLYYNNGKENTYYPLHKTEYDYIVNR